MHGSGLVRFQRPKALLLVSFAEPKPLGAHENAILAEDSECVRAGTAVPIALPKFWKRTCAQITRG